MILCSVSLKLPYCAWDLQKSAGSLGEPKYQMLVKKKIYNCTKGINYSSWFQPSTAMKYFSKSLFFIIYIKCECQQITWESTHTYTYIYIHFTSISNRKWIFSRHYNVYQIHIGSHSCGWPRCARVLNRALCKISILCPTHLAHAW